MADNADFKGKRGKSSMKIAPSVLAADFTKLGEEIQKVSGADYIHLDIMDGHFVPNISYGHELVAALRPLSKGLVLKPATPVEMLWPWLDKIEMVLVMTVEPGFGGQKFMEPMLKKVRRIKERAPHILVEVDGGINPQTISACAQAGVDICVAGTGVFRASDPAQALKNLQAY